MNVFEDSMKTFKQELIKLTFPILKFFEKKFSNLIKKKKISFKFLVMIAINASDGNPNGSIKCSLLCRMCSYLKIYFTCFE